jgi:hypothetical protein
LIYPYSDVDLFTTCFEAQTSGDVVLPLPLRMRGNLCSESRDCRALSVMFVGWQGYLASDLAEQDQRLS